MHKTYDNNNINNYNKKWYIFTISDNKLPIWHIIWGSHYSDQLHVVYRNI